MAATTDASFENSFAQLEAIPHDRHLLCPKLSDDDDEEYDDPDADGEITSEVKKQRISDYEERLHITYNCSLVLGLEQSPSTQGKLIDQFKNRVEPFLQACANCVRNWHRSREPFKKDLEQLFSSDDVAVLSNSLNDFDFDRINRGLIGAEEFIKNHKGIVEQKTFIEQEQTSMLIALYEALCCMPYLSIPENRQHFNYVFENIQRRKVLKLPEILPVMTHFLFDENKVRNAFAVSNWSRQNRITAEDFEWTVKDNLWAAMNTVNSQSTSFERIALFWENFQYILKTLDKDVVENSLRALEAPSIFDLLIGHMLLPSDAVLGPLLKVFSELIRKAPGTFWSAYSNFSRVAIAEQVFKNPVYSTLLQKSADPGMLDSAEATLWIEPLIDSLPTNQKSDVCDFLLRHLIEVFASDPAMSKEGQMACYLAAVQTLASTLTAFVSPAYKLYAGSTVQTNGTLNAALKHKALINEFAALATKGDARYATFYNAALTVIRSALMLDSRIAAEEARALENDNHFQREIRRDSPGLWDAFTETMSPHTTELAKTMLMATESLTMVEIYLPPKKQKLSAPKAEFNKEFQQTMAAVARMLERLEDFDKADLRNLCFDPATLRTFTGLLIHGEEIINEAGTSLIKTMTDEFRRADAVQTLLSDDRNFVPFISSFSKTVASINGKTQPWSSQRPTIRYSLDIVGALCDPSSGLLRSKTLSYGERQVISAWWKTQWEFLDVAFKQTDAWSRMVEMDTMKTFCREAMNLADALLEQDGLLASALSSHSRTSPSDSDTGDANVMKDILKLPQFLCDGLVKMIRLKDTYLVDLIVKIVCKLLKRLGDHELDMPANSWQFIKSAVVKNHVGKYTIGTNLTDAQRAEIVRAMRLEEEEEVDVQFLSANKVGPTKRQTKIDIWSKSMDELPKAARKDKPIEKPTVRSGKADVRELMQGGASTDKKTLSTLEKMKARQQAAPKPDPSLAQANMREKRAREKEEKERAKASAIAHAKALRAPKPTVTGEGSGLRGLSGIQGKDHAPEKSEIMVNSSSEDEDDSEDDAAYLAQTGTAHKGAATSKGVSSMKVLNRGPVKKQKIVRSAKDMRARLIPNMDQLHQAILEWDIFHEGEDPPNGWECKKVANSYGEPTQFMETFLPLLINEAWRSFVTDKAESTAKPFGIKVVNRMAVDKFIEVSTAMPIEKNKDRDRFLSEGDIVLLSTASNPLEVQDEPHCLARIWRTQFKKGSMEVSYRISGKAGPILSILMPQAELYATRITNMTTIEREYAALRSLQYYDLMQEILEAKPSPMLKFGDEAINKVMGNYQLNPGQAKAILNAKENDAFTLVQGPPGTGKTKTIIAMVGALLTGSFGGGNTGTAIKGPALPKTGSSAPSKKLLVCAPSNAAVDELVLRLKAGVKSTTGSFHKINVLRLGRSDAINAGVRDVTLDELVKARIEGSGENKGPSAREQMHQEAGKIKQEVNELRPQLESARASGDRDLTNRLQRSFDELKKRQNHIGQRIDADKDSGLTAARESEIQRRKIQQEILDSSQVLCATLSGSGHEMFKNLNVEFETVIIDEAAQCVELSALIPLKYGCQKCILVGDPKQLPPTVLSQSASRYGYDQSLFVRMQKNSPSDVHLLDTQYRMHPDISQFPSQEFYESRLLDGDDMRRLRYQPWHQSELLGPYRFFDVKGNQELGRKGRSLENTAEIRVAMQLYERFLTDYSKVDIKGKVGIITPYKGQLHRLRDEFTRQYGPTITDEIEFNTTDAFQGRECEIIIFSCVRAKPTGGIGFMTDIRRMNVGLTRAKSSLWVLGDSKALAQGEYWNKLIGNAKSRGLYTTGDIVSMLRQPGRKLPPPDFDIPVKKPDSPAPVENAVKSEPNPPAVDTKPDVAMKDVPSGPSGSGDKYKTPQLPQTYTLLERPGYNHVTGGFDELNDRGELIKVAHDEQRPVIHSSEGKKRPREDSDPNRPPKKPASGLLPGKRPVPSAPRAMARPQDPSAMSVLGIPPSGPSSSTIRPPNGPNRAPNAPPNAPKGPANGQPQGGPRPPPKKPAASSDPFIRRKPNRGR